VTPGGAVTEPPELARLAQASVWSLVHDARGSLWIGQVGALTRVDAGGVRTFGLADGVPPGPVRVLLPDPDGTLWLATYGGGLARFRNGRFERLTMRDGLFDDALSALLPDQRGRLWLLGNRGVSIVRRTRLDSVFTRRAAGVDGLTLGGEVGVPEGNGGFPAAWSDGRRFFFASVDGVTVVDPEELERRRISPQPVIEALVTPDGERPLDDVVGVAAGVRGTALRVSAPALDGRTVRLRYRVEGRREGWIEVGPERLVPLDGLPPGRHPIELATRDEWGGWSSAPAELVVEVQGRWWQLVWVRVLAVGLLLGIVVAALRGRALAAEARARALRHEIARRERAEAEAQARLHDLAHISRVAVAGELATSLAHELNQPLAAIVSNADAARRMLAAPVGAPGSGENVDDVLRDISSEGKRASGVIRTLREFLRRGAGEHQAVDLAEVIAEVLPVLRHLLERERVTVVVHGTVGLPRVMGDRIALQQVLMNLIMNAVEAMRDTPPELRLIEVRGHVVDGEVVLSVRDSGPGVEPARREQVFRPFETTKPGGMGMGLAISRSIAESHDGDLEVLDAEGGGAEFRLRLPAAPR
jgi:signal transduction histidine kinase